MIAFTFRIHLREPLLATALEGDPNSSISLPFIPGSMLRGALIARYLADHSLPDAATDSTCRRLFFNDHTRYLHAYPLNRKGCRTLPVPRAWKVEKGTKTPVYDLSVEPADMNQPKSLSEPFVWLDENEFELYKPAKQVNVHTQRDRKMGRAVEGAGAVFRYEAIAAEEALGGVILCADDAAADVLHPVLEQSELSMGGSRGAGYGLVEIQDIQRTADWHEVSVVPGDIPAGGELAITLLSDALMRDANGQYIAYLDPALVGTWLNARLEFIPERTHAQPSVVGGFNRKWGLPLPQTAVARAGSVYVFEVVEPISANRLGRLMAEGIGERRAEGFGRLAINWHSQYDQLHLREVSEPSPVPIPQPLSETSALLARTMAERMLRRTLDRKLVEQINRLRIVGPIANSQLSRLRVIARSALAEQDVTRISRYLDQLRETARKQFEDAHIEKQSLLEWLKARLGDSPDQVWHRLGLTQSDLPSIGDVQAAWTEALAQEYAIRMIDGMLVKATRERREQ